MPTVINESIAFQRLRSSIEWFDSPIQFFEASTQLVQQKCDAEARKSTTICDVFGVGLAIGTNKGLKHPISYYNEFKKYNLRMLYSAALSHVYDIYTNYLRMLVDEIQRKSEAAILSSTYGQKRIVKVHYQDINAAGTFADAVSIIKNEFFNGIKNTERHKDLLDEIKKISGVHYNQNMWEDVNFYMRYRNQLVHNFGKAEKNFVNKYSARFNPPIRIGGELP